MSHSARDVVAPIDSNTDIVRARERGRALAGTLGFSITDRVLIVTAISELARNILAYAVRGEICVRVVQNDSARGIGVVARDDGPGIDNVNRALTDGFSTSGGLGLGLPGVRRLMDDFQIESRAGEGTTVRVTKWLSDGHEGGLSA
jgi:serine/threonine-protein kinase RsbT